MVRSRWISALLCCCLFVVACPLAALAWNDRIDGPWNPEGVQELRVVVTLSANRVAVYRGDEQIRSYVASVGRPGHRTPVGRRAIRSVTLNPWWHPPPSPWARGRRPEPPGPTNPMGRVKLNFHALYYIHGTPDTARLGRPVSHGCVRVSNEDAMDLARLVLQTSAPALSEAELDDILADRRTTRTVQLVRPVPVEVVR